MQRFRLRRLWRVNCEALVTASGQNLKRLLQKRGWGRHPFPAEARAMVPPASSQAERPPRHNLLKSRRPSVAVASFTSYGVNNLFYFFPLCPSFERISVLGRLGRTIKCTANHKFLTAKGWKRLDQLSTGEHLALPRYLQGQAMPANSMINNQTQIGLGGSYCGTDLYKQNISRERAMRLAEAVPSEELVQLAPSDVYWDEIIDIVRDEETDVYDLTVEGLHNFVANDIIVHNSIEADADVVMFIYRDDVYNPASERPNTADIIIAKHRNGPVGEVTLAFDKSQTRFRDIFNNRSGEEMVFEETQEEIVLDNKDDVS